ncbi:hypothetical protein ABIA16_001763 [Sinorhizobium fredii]
MRWFWQKNEAEDDIEAEQAIKAYAGSKPEDEDLDSENDAIMNDVIFRSQTADRFE